MMTLFFATKEDFLPVIEDVERRIQVQYVRAGLHKIPRLEVFEAGRLLPLLGVADKESAINCAGFLVMRGEIEPSIRHVEQMDGSLRYAIDQQENPDSILLQHGGALSPEVFLHGRIATISSAPISQEIFRLFKTSIRKSFEKIKAYYVGDQCRRLLDQGVRLTPSAQSPRDGDLIL